MDKVLPYIILSIQEQNVLFYNQKYCITKIKCFANTTQIAAIAILSYILPLWYIYLWQKRFISSSLWMLYTEQLTVHSSFSFSLDSSNDYSVITHSDEKPVPEVFKLH